ncbi:unnamed protein product [Prorocentrum cordatum]|uniref:Uncharacterized protein n=1 Tax=Prorocentrum cordatum TaxID=2364126 RepID=A0ABN9UEZ0_9DINO|nr:unnamed protein product [Polarella glacialis]
MASTSVQKCTRGGGLAEEQQAFYGRSARPAATRRRPRRAGALQGLQWAHAAAAALALAGVAAVVALGAAVDCECGSLAGSSCSESLGSDVLSASSAAAGSELLQLLAIFGFGGAACRAAGHGPAAAPRGE